MQRQWQRLQIPEWVGQSVTTVLIVTITAVALLGVVAANSSVDDDDATFPPIAKRVAAPVPPSPPRVSSHGPQPYTIVVVSSGEQRDTLAQAVAGDRLIRLITGEPAREIAILVHDGTDLDLLRQVVAEDDAMMLAPPTVFVDLR